MPRPGPRPYDCVRRAWHSDTHQPIRGTLIQEFFRVVNDIHGPATKKNKEYQEKLPIVVLRAEEIMYSKANSEAEYMDLTTLLVRANDAIDTVIRRDESTETGEHLLPCIEAALCLGCTPVKASRSQRNSPRCYLSPTVQEPVQKPARGVHIAKPHFVSPCSNFVKSTRLGSEYPRLAFRNNGPIPSSNTSAFVSDHFPSTSKKQCLEYQPLSNLFSVYPLYYGNHLPVDESHHGSTILHKSVSNTSGPAIVGGVGNHLASNVTASNQKPQSLKRGDPDQNQPTMGGCDLSLRLGPLSSVEERNKLSGELAQTIKNSLPLCGTDQQFRNARQISFV
ncbi:uncharacterized protein LOC114735708 isoform X1 [Neltuma alba]|uniref:uncharacterized protein LOC114735708 isoform X1 n=1 Tax=Neltuma alba TaxID=207710 RepID=UPI0010A374EB|nr:uncharacterized protein LOC114735708 isoform X1 [Prosopis alba]